MSSRKTVTGGIGELVGIEPTASSLRTTRSAIDVAGRS